MRYHRLRPGRHRFLDKHDSREQVTEQVEAVNLTHWASLKTLVLKFNGDSTFSTRPRPPGHCHRLFQIDRGVSTTTRLNVKQHRLGISFSRHLPLHPFFDTDKPAWCNPRKVIASAHVWQSHDPWRF